MIGREEQLATLQNYLASDQNNFTILYGRRGIGKTTLIQEFIKGKNYAYFEAGSAADFEQIRCMARCLKVEDAEDYDMILATLYQRGVRLFILEEFQNLVKADPGFMSSVVYFLKNTPEKIMVICTCSSISWVENSMVKAIGSAAFSINAFIKLKELSYVDMVSMFPQCDAATILTIYAVTGGVPAYASLWNPGLSDKQNISNMFLGYRSPLCREADNYLNEEFREIAVYNTILHCLADGKNKLNDIHEYTGYGRDKISVYLKNLMEREIVEKVFSYDAAGNENTRKGLYRIREGFMKFWYGYVYPTSGCMMLTTPEEFFEMFIENTFSACKLDAFIQVAGEFLEIMESMGRLPFACEKKGGWYGKKGDLHLIFESEAGDLLVGNVFVKDTPIELADYEKMQETVSQMGANCQHYYMFSISGFSKELQALQSENLVLVDIKDL